jgi:hypothetical protein
MSAAAIAEKHFKSAITEAGEGVADAMCRAMMGLIVAQYLQTRSVEDVQSELRFVADNCDPDADFAFMRP